MKNILFLLLLFPFIGYGQAAKPNNPIDGLVTCLHYDTAAISGPLTTDDKLSEEDILKTIKDDIKYRGNVEFKIGFTDIKCDEAVSNENKRSLTAKNVQMT